MRLVQLIKDKTETKSECPLSITEFYKMSNRGC